MSPAVFLLAGLLLLWLVFTGRLTATWRAITGQAGTAAAAPVQGTTAQAVKGQA